MSYKQLTINKTSFKRCYNLRFYILFIKYNFTYKSDPILLIRNGAYFLGNHPRIKGNLYYFVLFLLSKVSPFIIN